MSREALKADEEGWKRHVGQVEEQAHEAEIACEAESVRCSDGISPEELVARSGEVLSVRRTRNKQTSDSQRQVQPVPDGFGTQCTRGEL